MAAKPGGVEAVVFEGGRVIPYADLGAAVRLALSEVTTIRRCAECGRVFDLFDEIDAAEWAYGHDCEVN